MAKSENSNLIISLVDELRALDNIFRVFGSKEGKSWGHGYVLNKVVEPHLIDAFESKHDIQLPEDYRNFLIEVGNGGAGPYYGIKTLWDAAQYSSLDKEFPWSTQASDLTESEHEVWDRRPGVLMLTEQGCGIMDFLIVRGQVRGQIWTDCSSERMGLIPSHYTFTDWYLEWVTRCINTIKREPLIDQVCAGMTMNELRAILGWDMRRWTSEVSLPDSPCYYIGFTNTNASFSMSEDDRVLNINKSDMIF